MSSTSLVSSSAWRYEKHEIREEAPVWRPVTIKEEGEGYSDQNKRWGTLYLYGKNNSLGLLPSTPDTDEPCRYSEVRYMVLVKTWDVKKLAVTIFDQLALLASQQQTDTSYSKKVIFYLSNVRVVFSRAFLLISPHSGWAPNLSPREERDMVLNFAPQVQEALRCYREAFELVKATLSQAAKEQEKHCPLSLVRKDEVCGFDGSLPLRDQVDMKIALEVNVTTLQENSSDDPDRNVFLRAAEILDPTGEYMGSPVT